MKSFFNKIIEAAKPSQNNSKPESDPLSNKKQAGPPKNNENQTPQNSNQNETQSQSLPQPQAKAITYKWISGTGPEQSKKLVADLVDDFNEVSSLIFDHSKPVYAEVDHFMDEFNSRESKNLFEEVQATLLLARAVPIEYSGSRTLVEPNLHSMIANCRESNSVIKKSLEKKNKNYGSLITGLEEELAEVKKKIYSAAMESQILLWHSHLNKVNPLKFQIHQIFPNEKKNFPILTLPNHLILFINQKNKNNQTLSNQTNKLTLTSSGDNTPVDSSQAVTDTSGPSAAANQNKDKEASNNNSAETENQESEETDQETLP